MQSTSIELRQPDFGRQPLGGGSPSMRVGISRLPGPNLVNDTPPRSRGRHYAPLNLYATAALPILSRFRLLIESKFLPVDPLCCSPKRGPDLLNRRPRFFRPAVRIYPSCDLRS